MRAWLQDLRQRFGGSRFFKNVAVLAGGTGIAQVLAIAVSPILTRLYSPGDYGTVGVYASLLGIASIVASAKYELAIPLPDDDDDAADLLGLSLLIGLAMTVIMALLVLFLGPMVVVWTNTPELAPYLWLLPVGLLGAGWYQVFHYWAVRNEDFRRIARTRILQGTGGAAVKLGMGLFVTGPLGLIVGTLVSQVAGIGSLAAFTWRSGRQALRNIRPSGMGRMAVRYRRFPLLSSWAVLVTTVGLNITPLMLAAIYNAGIVGWFELCRRVISVPLQLIGNSVATVYFAESARLAGKNPRELRTRFFGLAGQLGLLGLAPAAVLALFGSWIFAFVFGEEWRQAGQFMQLMAPMLLVQFIVTPVAAHFSALERQDLSLLWSVLRLSLVAGALLFAWWAELPALYAVGLYSAAMIVSYTVLFFLAAHALNHRIRKTAAEDRE